MEVGSDLPTQSSPQISYVAVVQYLHTPVSSAQLRSDQITAQIAQIVFTGLYMSEAHKREASVEEYKYTLRPMRIYFEIDMQSLFT